MHYYQFNIADYRKDTGHLTPVEHYIYRWLIDEYHLSEKPINNNMYKLLRRLGLDEDSRDQLEMVLDEFFIPACDEDYSPKNVPHDACAQVGDHPELCQYWIHSRIEQGIESYKEFISNKSAAGRASVEARKKKKNTSLTPVEQNLTEGQLTTNHKPLTTNHKPLNKGRFTPPSVSEVQTYIDTRDVKISAEMFVDHYQANGWLRGKNKIKDWKACVRTWEQKEAQRIEPPKQQSTKQRTLEQDLTDTSWAN